MKQRKWIPVLLCLALALCLLPARAAAAGEDNTIPVTFTLVGDTVHGENGPVHIYSQDRGSGRMWIERKSFTVAAGATAFDVFEKALSASSITYTEKSPSYIDSITRDALTLGSESNGKNSGWMYLVNGASPAVGIRDYTLSSGDDIVFFYTDDFTKETAPAAGNVASFADVPVGSWYAGAVQYVHAAGLMQGDGGLFAPDRTMTRAMFVSVLYRLDGSPETASASLFADVSDNSWYAGAVYWAKQSGITSGVSPKRFDPDAAVTREQAATLLYHYALYKKYDATQGGMRIREYDDYDGISAYALEGMAWTVNTGILQGSGNRLEPRKSLSRAQAALLFQRLSVQES